MGMLVYPQLATGALTQFPVRKRLQMRTVTNLAADGSAVKLADPAGEMTEWRLEYAGLTDAEAAALEEFFEAAEGTLNGFTFVDPVGNLLTYSEELDNAAWSADPMLTVSAGDPGAWHLANMGEAAQGITQTLPLPGGYVYCLSVYLKAAQTTAVSLVAGAGSRGVGVGNAWQRFQYTATVDASAQTTTFGLQLPAGAAVDAQGFQVEAQPGASVYKATTTSGVYENARLADDRLAITATGVNHHAATVNIIHANHL
jgi:hypothetical protein